MSTFGILVFSKVYTFPILLFSFQRPDIGRRLANMPLDSFVAVRGWVYPRPPGQHNVVNIIYNYPCMSYSQISKICNVYIFVNNSALSSKMYLLPPSFLCLKL
jgi:hypothetical protein